MTRKVLIVEDEEYVLHVLKTILGTDGYRILTAKNGESAKMKILTHQPDMILLDLGLPDIDGVDLLKKLRSWTKVPVLVVSARTTEKDKVLALDQGADDYISKPFSSPELLARIRAAFRRNIIADYVVDTFSVGDFLIDFEKRVVTVKSVPVRLTQIEYQIVELIARQPGKVMTYGYLIKNIWGPYADTQNNRILRVNMSNIRRKIEEDSMNPRYILTEIGVGYRMAEN